MNPVSVRYGGYVGYRHRFGEFWAYRYDTNFLMQYLYHISVYRYHTDISVSYRYIGIGIGSVWGILGISVSVRYGGFWRYWYDTDFLMQYLYHISVYRYHTDISVSYRYISIGIGLVLGILGISVSV